MLIGNPVCLSKYCMAGLMLWIQSICNIKTKLQHWIKFVKNLSVAITAVPQAVHSAHDDKPDAFWFY